MTTKVGIVGCGNISGIYLKNGQQTFENIEIAACADVILERAEAQAEAYGVPRACTTEELLADPEIEIVINLTTPQGHHPVAMQAIAAGKSVHNEKPLALTREQGKELLAAAAAQGVRVGGAPDTFLG
ncbi:MAG: Gfo/Idh/MocA family oxidoreductase, partial [Anaerolineae bacterium]|nr:Gfo/Idh/MocA family oxidoreductase [Anaerolineae bacterium]